MIKLILSENDFFTAHEDIKAQGGYIVRCLQRDGGKYRTYELIWIKKREQK